MVWFWIYLYMEQEKNSYEKSYIEVENENLENIIDKNKKEDGKKRNILKNILKKKVYIIFFIITFLFSSFFGAFFGFVSGIFSNILVSKFESKIEKSFPFLKETSQVDVQQSKQEILVEDSAVIDVVKNSSPGVVSIIISKNISTQRDFFNDPFGFYFNFDQNNNIEEKTKKQQVGGGSGFFISKDGLILTNKHVVEDVQAEYSVMTNDGKEYQAKVLARDPIADIAVIKIEGDNFSVIPMGDSDNLQVGQTVVAIGNSLGEFANSVSRGIVSGLKRNLEAGSKLGSQEILSDIIQTDAAINPGNSGGPLLDINGNVIGINVAIAQGAQNVGFALPINQAKMAADQVKQTGKISVPFLGIRYQEINIEMQKENNLPFSYGVIVLGGANITDFGVLPGSPADKAGIVERDIILEIDGQKIDEKNSLSNIIAKHKVGDSINLKVWHKGDTKDVKIILEERKN